MRSALSWGLGSPGGAWRSVRHTHASHKLQAADGQERLREHKPRAHRGEEVPASSAEAQLGFLLPGGPRPSHQSQAREFPIQLAVAPWLARGRWCNRDVHIGYGVLMPRCPVDRVASVLPRGSGADRCDVWVKNSGGRGERSGRVWCTHTDRVAHGRRAGRTAVAGPVRAQADRWEGGQGARGGAADASVCGASSLAPMRSNNEQTPKQRAITLFHPPPCACIACPCVRMRT